jgi:hypothetical protein
MCSLPAAFSVFESTRFLQHRLKGADAAVSVMWFVCNLDFNSEENNKLVLFSFFLLSRRLLPIRRPAERTSFI